MENYEPQYSEQNAIADNLWFSVGFQHQWYTNECFPNSSTKGRCETSDWSLPVLRSAKRAPANVRRLNNRKWRQRYCLVGERSRALALLNAALHEMIYRGEQSAVFYIMTGQYYQCTWVYGRGKLCFNRNVIK